MNLRIASILGYALMVATLVFLLLRQSLLATSIPTIALQIAAFALMVWARITFGRRSFHLAANATDGGLVTSGPYRFVRHPIYAAVLLFVVAGVATRLGLTTVLATLVMVAGISLRVHAEEVLVNRQYPEYAAYAEKTKRIVPFVL